MVKHVEREVFPVYRDVLCDKCDVSLVSTGHNFMSYPMKMAFICPECDELYSLKQEDRPQIVWKGIGLGEGFKILYDGV